jgi:hypothetical protein
VFDTGYFTGSMLEVMDVSRNSLFDDLLPSSRQQLAKMLEDLGVPDRILDRTTRYRLPSSRNRARSVNVGVYM